MSLKHFNLPFTALPPSRKLRGTRARGCVYCAAPAGTRDHVPPKVLLEEPWPPNLRTVPACEACNGSWSLHEQYFAIVLASVGHVPHLMAKVDPDGSVDRALQAAPLLDDLVIRSLVPGREGGILFTVDLSRIGAVAAKIAHGLYCLRYGPGASPEGFTPVWLSGPGEEPPQFIVAAMWYWPGIRRKRWTTVQEDSFSFLFAAGWMIHDPPLYCLINFHNTILAAISCPPPVGRRKSGRLRSRPW